MSGFPSQAIMLMLVELLLGACAPATRDQTVTWFDDVLPIVKKHCNDCHAPGGVGGLVFDETTAPILIGRMLSQIQPACDDKGCKPPRMPPWLPGPESVEFVGDRSLSAKELALFAAWAKNPVLGAPRASEIPNDQPKAPPTAMLSTQPYVASPSAHDEIRCFILHPPPGHLTSYAWVIDERQAVHHLSADLIGAPSLKQIEALDGADGRPGWDCTSSMPPVTALATLINTSIAPGNRFSYAAGYGVEVPEGAAFVLSVHFLPVQEHADITGVDLWYSDAAVKPVSIWTVFAPSNLPCPPSMADSPQCQPAAAEQRAIKGDGLPNHTDLVQHCGPEILGPETAGSFPVKGSCLSDLPPGIIRVLSVRVHAHTYATGARLRAQTPIGSWFTLLDIPLYRWYWEGMYVPVEDIQIAGQAFFEIALDNGAGNQWSAATGRPSDGPGIPPLQPPSTHALGLGQRDEMALATIEWAEP